MRYWQVGHLFFISAFLSGCAKQHSIVVKPAVDHLPVQSHLQELSPLQILTQEERAHLLDIPFPPGIIPFTLQTRDKRQHMLMYEVTGSLEELCAFHRAEMDYHKWHERGIFLADESCLAFEKVSRQCIIILRPLSVNKYRVIICVGPKKQVVKDLF